MIREKRTKSGKMLEVDFFPVWADGRKMPSKSRECKKKPFEIEKSNRKRAIKKLIRLMNANFGTGDSFLHPTYPAELAPQSEEEARKNIVNFLRRVKRRRVSELEEVKKELAAAPDNRRLKEKFKKLSKPFKYIYVIEKKTYKRGEFAGRDNWHYHIIMTGGLDRETIEDMWTYGKGVNCDRYQPEKFGIEAAAKYMAKSPEGSHRFVCSKNLTKPTEKKPKDGKITPRGVERIAKFHVDDAAYWEKRYKGYSFLRCYNRYNPYNGHWYVSAIMYQKGNEPLPPFDIDDWIDD